MNHLLAAAFAELDRAGVDWCLLRGADDLAAPTGDVDLLVSAAHAERADAALGAAGFEPQRTWAGGSQRFFLGRDEEGRWVLLHVTTRVAFGDWYELETSTAEGVLRRRRRDGDLALTSHADELWTSVLHCLLDKGRVTEKHRRRLPLLADHASADDEVAREVADRCRGAWDAAAVLDHIQAADWEALESIATPLERTWRDASPTRTRAGAARNALSLWSRKLAEPLTRPGVSVALLAPDGAGKSTVAAGLDGAFQVPVRTLYLGLYGAAMRKPPIALPGAGLATRVATVRWRWLVGRWHKLRRRVVVFDRHPVEATMGDPATSSLARARRALLARSAPLPDLVVVLDAPGDVLASRKDEHDATWLEANRQGYLALAARLPNTVVIDATLPPDVVQRAVVDAVWGRLCRR